MARIDGPVRTCDRDFGDVVATDTLTFTVDGRRYTIDVCAKHKELFRLNLAAWVAVAHEQTAAGVATIPAQPRVREAVQAPEPLVVVRTVERVEHEPVI